MSKKTRNTSTNRLTDRKVRSAKPGWHPDGGKLYLFVKPSGRRSWILRYVSPTTGKRRDMGLGPYPDVSLADARELASQYRRQLHVEKTDPLELKAARATDKTFEAVAEECIADRRSTWKPGGKSELQWRQTLTDYAYPVMGKLGIKQINVDHLLAVLRPIWNEKSETADRVQQRIETVINYSIARGYRNGDNPARRKGHLDQILGKRDKKRKRVKHHAALPWQEIGDFMAELKAQEGLAARCLELVILTATRSSEALKAQWDEFDLSEKVWVVPPERIKTHTEHRIPLSPAAVRLVKSIPRIKGSPFVFPGLKPGKPLSSMAMAVLLKRMGRSDITVHGMRSCFRDWTAEQTNIPRELAEKALAHVVGNEAERAYQRGDLLERRRKVMEKWSRWCATPSADKVVRLAR